MKTLELKVETLDRKKKKSFFQLVKLLNFFFGQRSSDR